MTILITGANRGIGRAMRRLALDRGDEVIGACRGNPPEPGEWLPLELADPQSVRALGAALADRPLATLVCNAGVYADRGQELDDGYPADVWAESFAVNATGVFLTIQALLPNLRAFARATAAGGAASAPARIAILSSQMASQERAPGGSYAYRASKAAVLNIGRNLATDLRDDGIAVGIYHPGWVQTDMGGADAAITPEVAAAGLLARIDALDLATSGVFETWDGQPHPF